MLRKNIILFKLQSLFNGLWLFAALAIIYFETITKSYAIAMLVFAVVNISQSISEVPCGMYSDRMDRKRTLVIGSICVLINMILWALAGTFNSVFLLFVGSVMRGVGLAFKSGTDNAMIYETLQQIRERKLFMVVLSKINSFYQLGALIAAFVSSVFIFYFSLNTLVWLAVLPYIGVVAVNCMMVNPKNNFPKDMNVKQQIVKSIKTFIKNKKLRKYALLNIFNISLLNSVFRFESTYYEQLIPLHLINIVRALQHCSGWISYHLVQLFSGTNVLKLLSYSTLGSAVVRLFGLIINNAVSPFIMSAQNLFYGTTETSSATILQREYSGGLRATLESIIGLFGGIGIGLIGFLMGVAADIFSPRTVLFICVFLSMIISLSYRRLFRPSKQNKKA